MLNRRSAIAAFALGCSAFALDDKGPPMCVNCGTRATGWADG